MNQTYLYLNSYVESFYFDITSQQHKFTILSQLVLCEKSKIVSFASSIMSRFFLFPSRSRFPVKLMCYIAFGPASRALLFTEMYSYNILMFFKTGIIQQATGFVITSLSRCNCQNVIICSYHNFPVDHSIVAFYFYFRKKISCVYCALLQPHYLEIMQKNLIAS